MRIGAVVVTFETPGKILLSCLASLRSGGIGDIAVIKNTKENNPGFAAAANAGAARLSNDYLLFINPDAFLAPGAGEAAQKYLDSHPSVGVVGLHLSSPAGVSEVNSCGVAVTPLSLFTRRFTRRPLPGRPASIGWVSGGAMLIRRGLFWQLGGFDPRFFMYWEDVDLCRRARQAGRRVVFLPQAKVVHQRGSSLKDRQLKTRIYDQSADKYFRKHYSTMICLSVRSARFLYRLFSPLSS